jgi:hypothetical protein
LLIGVQFNMFLCGDNIQEEEKNNEPHYNKNDYNTNYNIYMDFWKEQNKNPEKNIKQQLIRAIFRFNNYGLKVIGVIGFVGLIGLIIFIWKFKRKKYSFTGIKNLQYLNLINNRLIKYQ